VVGDTRQAKLQIYLNRRMQGIRCVLEEDNEYAFECARTTVDARAQDAAVSLSEQEHIERHRRDRVRGIDQWASTGHASTMHEASPLPFVRSPALIGRRGGTSTPVRVRDLTQDERDLAPLSASTNHDGDRYNAESESD